MSCNLITHTNRKDIVNMGYKSLTINKYNALLGDIKYLRVPISYFLDPNISINAAVILSLFKFRNQLSLINHRIHKGTSKDRYFDKQKGTVFIRFMMKELLHIFRGTGKKAIRNAINQLNDANYINIDKPKHSWKRKNEYEILKKAYSSFDYAMSPNGTLQHPQTGNVRIINTPKTNTSLRDKDTRMYDTRNVRDARKPEKPARPKTAYDKQVEVAKLNAQAAHDEAKTVQYKYRHKYHLQDIKQKQNIKATDKIAKNTASIIHLPKVVDRIKEWSFNDPATFKYYAGLMFEGKHWATYNFKHDKNMNHEDYKFLSWGLQFEMNDAYRTDDFANKISDVINYTHNLPTKAIKTSKKRYMRGWFTRIFMTYAKEYCEINNPIRIKERENKPSIPLDVDLSGGMDDAVNNNYTYGVKSDKNGYTPMDPNDPGNNHLKLHPTSAKMKAKIKRQLAALDSRD